MRESEMLQRHAVTRVAANGLIEQRHGLRWTATHEMRHREKTQRIRIARRALQDLLA
ncbi:hypothetical protein D3C83_175100 [compost metagenome]